MSELVKVVRPVHAPGEFCLMAAEDMVEGEKLFVEPKGKTEPKPKTDAEA